MTHAESLLRVIEVLRSLPDITVPPGGIQETHTLARDLGVDSKGGVDLIIALEDEFGIFVNPVTHDLEAGFESVGTLSQLVDELVAEADAPQAAP
jgi:acyl carrier protein